MKKSIAIILALLLLIGIFGGCSTVGDLPEPSFPPYPYKNPDGGYTVTGAVKDESGNPLPGAILKIGDKVRAITDSEGTFKITSLSGEVKIRPSFKDYKFVNEEITVNGTATGVDFVGKNKYTAAMTASFSNGATFYGTYFTVNGKNYAPDFSGTTYVDNLNGTTVITPYHEFFDFSPKSATVYSNEYTRFTVTPKEGTYTVSGSIDTSKFKADDVIPQVYIAVDGKKYCDVVSNYVYDNQGNGKLQYSYSVYGLSPSKEKGYTVSLIDSAGNFARETFTVTEPRKDLNFLLQITKKINIALVPASSKPENLIPDNKFDYVVTVKDENGVQIFRKYGAEQIFEGITVWAGCKVYIDGIYNPGGGAQIKEYEEVLTITESMMRSVETDYELAYYLFNYVEEE